MKILIVYYSRSGNTRKIAELIGRKMGAEIEEIIDHKNRKGLLGFLISGNESYLQRNIPIKQLTRDPSQYDLIIIGTPIWAGHMCSPIKSFCQEYQGKFPRIAFFTTSLGSNPSNIFLTVEQLTGQKPIAVMNFTNRDIKKQYHLEMIDEFIDSMKKALKD